MKPRDMLWMGLLAATLAYGQEAERTTARDTRVPAVSQAAAFTVW